MIIDKVYDEFATKDWVYTQDNLNPVREIDYTGRISLEEMRNRLLGNINARLDYILDNLESQEKAKFDDEEMGSEVISSDAPRPNYFGLFEDIFNRMPQLRDKVLRLQLYLDDGDEEPLLPNFDDQRLSNYITIMTNFDCAEFDEDRRKQLNPDYFHGNSSSKSDYDEMNEQLDLVDGFGDFTGRRSQPGSGTPQNYAKACVPRTLRLLSIILGLCQMVQLSIAIVNTVQQICTVIDDIMHAVSCVWVYGLSVPKIKDLILNLIIEFMSWILSLIIKLLYRLLDFRCLKENVLSLLDQLKTFFKTLMGLINGVKSVLNMAQALPSMISQTLDSFLQAFSKFQIVNANKMSFREKVKEAFSFDNFMVDLKAGLKDGTINVVFDSDLVKDAMEIFNASVDTAQQASVAWSAVTGNDATNVTQGLNKLATKMNNLKVTLKGQS